MNEQFWTSLAFFGSPKRPHVYKPTALHAGELVCQLRQRFASDPQEATATAGRLRLGTFPGGPRWGDYWERRGEWSVLPHGELQ